jgi:transposase
MPCAITLRPDFRATELRRLARRSKDAAQARRLLALAAIYDGGTRSEAARLGNVTLQIVRDWVVRFNAEGPEALIDRKAPGPTPLLTDAHRQALAAQIDTGPIPAIHGVVRWRLCDLGQWLWEEFRVSVSPQTLSREVRALGFRKLSARPKHYAQATGAIEAFKKTSPPRWQASRASRASASTRSRSGSPTKPASARRTASPAAGHGAGPGPRRRRTSATPRPTSSAPSARRRARARPSSCPSATPPR